MLVEHFSKGNKAAFARAAGISNQSLAEILGARQSAPSFTALQKMLNAFPQVCIEWFIFGRGPMLRAEGVELLDTEGVVITPEEAKNLLQLQEANAAQNERLQADFEQMQSDLNRVRYQMQAFLDTSLSPEKAKQIKEAFPDSFPSSEA